jgi:hypothetical protein
MVGDAVDGPRERRGERHVRRVEWIEQRRLRAFERSRAVVELAIDAEYSPSWECSAIAACGARIEMPDSSLATGPCGWPCESVVGVELA